jgi:hypothetical protein
MIDKQGFEPNQKEVLFLVSGDNQFTCHKQTFIF